MKIAFFSTQSYDREYFNRFREEFEFVYFEAPLNEQTSNLATGCSAVCVFVNDQLNAIVIRQLERLGVKLIALRCAGYNNVDLETARQNDIAVVRVPAYSPHAVAEHAVALILTLNRKTHKAYNRVREGNFSLDKLVGFDLFGKKVGVIGTGKIGETFAKLMLGFGCTVFAFDPFVNENLTDCGVEYLLLPELISLCDIISLHCPLNEQTRHLINSKTIASMKKGVMLINTGRGALIDTNAVIAALKRGQIGQLGLDVYEQEEQLFFRNLSEEIIQDDLIMRLMSFPNVLITAHQAFFTDEALSQIAQTTVQNIKAYTTRSKLVNQVI